MSILDIEDKRKNVEFHKQFGWKYAFNDNLMMMSLSHLAHSQITTKIEE